MRRALASAVLAAMALAVSTPAETADTISFGSVLPLSGNRKNSGSLYRRAYDLAADWINQHGGIVIGGKSRAVRLKYVDDGSDEMATGRLYEKLITEDGVNFLLGPFGSASVLAAAAAAEKHEVPLVHGGGAAPMLFQQRFSFTFGLLPRAADFLDPLLALMVQLQPRIRSLALAHADDAFDREAASGFRKGAADIGFALTVDETYASGTKDFSIFLDKVKAANPDAVILAGHDEETRQFIRQARQRKVRPRIICSTSGAIEGFSIKSLGADAEALFGVTPWLNDMRFTGEVFGTSGEFARLYREAYKDEPDYHAAAAAATLAVFKKAVETAGSLDRRKVRDALAAVSVDTIYGPVSFHPDGRIKGSVYLHQVQSGKRVRIFPSPEVMPLYPMPPWSQDP